MQNAITGTLRNIRVQPSKAKSIAPVGPLSESVFGSCVFVPAFSVGGVTLGFGMHEFNYTRGQEWGDGDMMFMRTPFRFVRNDKRAELLIVHDMQDMNAMSMEYTRMVTPTCQWRASVCFNRDTLCDVIERGVMNVSAFEPTVDQVYCVYEYRSCPTCCEDRYKCRCALASGVTQFMVHKPKHPFDHSAFARNMTHRLGVWEGVATVSCFQNGAFQAKHVTGCRNVVVGGVDVQLILSMRDWSLANHVREKNASPLTLSIVASYCDESVSQATQQDTNNECTALTISNHTESMSWLDTDTDLALSDLPPLTEIQDDPFLNTPPASVCESVLQTAMERGKEHMIQPLIDLSGATSEEVSENKGDSDDLVRMLKAELRRKRNRVSAQRSNLKKKKQNEHLKHELSSVKQRAQRLRSRESALRNENLQLRNIIQQT